jgi:outer membrane biosynthesis protein TonB
MTMAHLEKNNSATPLIAIRLALLTVILANPPQSAAQQKTTPAQPSAPPPQTASQPRPNPDASGIYHVGDGVTAPKLIYSAEPEFSEKAQKRKIAGCSVAFRFIVETDGHVRDVHAFKSCADAFKDKKDREAAQTLDQEGLKAVSQYRFEPAKFQDHPVPVELSAEVFFNVY